MLPYPVAVSLNVDCTGYKSSRRSTAKLIEFDAEGGRSKLSPDQRRPPPSGWVITVGSPASEGVVEPATYVTPAGSTSRKDTLNCGTPPAADAGFDPVSV